MQETNSLSLVKSRRREHRPLVSLDFIRDGYRFQGPGPRNDQNRKG